MAGTVYLVMAMRRPDFNDAAVQPHRDFLDALQAQGKLQLTGGFAEAVVAPMCCATWTAWRRRRPSSPPIRW